MKHRKSIRILSALLALTLLLAITPQLTLTAHAAETSGKCGDNLTWSFNETTGILTISGYGEMYNYSYYYDTYYGGDSVLPWLDFSDSIRKVSLPNGLTSIGNCAFYVCRSLSDVMIPNGVTSIGDYAFVGCSSLTELVIPNSVTSIGNNAFEYCSSLREVIIPDSVTTIGEWSFRGCERIESLTISNNLESINHFAFMECYNLTSVVIPDGVASIGQQAFDECYRLREITIPDSVTSIGSFAFWSCQSLTEITIPSGVTSIGENAIKRCTNLKSITVKEGNANYCSEDGVLFDAGKTVLICCPSKKTGKYQIPSSVTYIEDEAFLECSELTEIIIPDSVTRIGEMAFCGCTKLTELTIPDSVTGPLGGVFAGCENLIKVTLSKKLTSIGEQAFCYCTSLAEITIPENVTSIGYLAFEDCSSLKSISIPRSVTEIGYRAFEGCSCLHTITVDAENELFCSDGGVLFSKWKTTLIRFPAGKTDAYQIPDSVKSIAAGAFQSCSNLTSVTIPQGVTHIESNAFQGCNNLSSITVPDSLTIIGSWAFSGCENLRSIQLPESVTSIGEGAFCRCSSLTSVAIPGGVTSIDYNTFGGCVNLREVIIPDSVTRIDYCVFEECHSLTSVTIPNSVTSIEGRAFFGCSNLMYVTIPARVTSFGEYVFEHCDNLRAIYGVPGSAAEEYANNNGIQFRDINSQADFAGFRDVPADAYYAEPVAWAVERGVTNGTSNSTFSPESTCTRAQVVTFLWRAAGCPEPTQTVNPFADVKEGQYYYKAVLWAVEQGITTGTSANRFSPDSGCTRAQVVTFLWRAMGRPMPWSFDNFFTDVDLNEYYGGAVLWAIENGITNGTSPNRFSPNATCTRAQIVTFLFRTYEQMIYPIPINGNLIGVSLPTRDLQRWNQDGDSIKKELEAAGYDVDLQFAANDPSMQISQLENMIANGARVLIVAAIDGSSLGTVLEQAKEAGCTVIAYDRPINSGAVSYYVTIDNYDIGAAQGRFIADALDLANAGDRVYNLELIGGDPNDSSAPVVYAGAMSVLQRYIDAGTLKVVSGQVDFRNVATEGWSSERAQERFENLLSTYYADKQLDAVMCSNDSTAQGVVVALENAYRNDVYPIITGQDCDIVSVKNMLRGKQAMSVFKDTRILAARTVAMADDIMKGFEPHTNATYTTYYGEHTYPAFCCEPTICTKDTVQSLLIDSGYYSEAELRP